MSKEMAMEFSIRNHDLAFSHIVLKSREVAMAIAETSAWKDGEKLTAEVFVNGVQVPTKVIESLMQEWYSDLEKQVRKDIAPEGFNALVEKEVLARIESRTDGLLEKVARLQELLSDPSNLIRPYWERP